jgi:hypothetical protein
MQPCADIARFFYGEFAYLIKRLAETKEGDKTLLDSTAVLLCSEVGDPPSHDFKRIPFIIAGSGGGLFRTGRYLKLGGKPHHMLLVALMNAYGLTETSIGDEKYNDGALTGLG